MYTCSYRSYQRHRDKPQPLPSPIPAFPLRLATHAPPTHQVFGSESQSLNVQLWGGGQHGMRVEELYGGRIPPTLPDVVLEVRLRTETGQMLRITNCCPFLCDSDPNNQICG